MSNAPRILAFAGSASRESFNKRLIRIAVDGARQAGDDVTHIDLADFPLPIFLAAYKGKVAALVAASPGKLGGLCGLVHVRSILGNIGVLVLPDQLAVPEAQQAFTDEGRLKDERQQATVERIGRSLVELTCKLKAAPS